MNSFLFYYFCKMIKEKKVAFYTLGCKLNFAETSTISRQLTNIGFKKTKFDDNADVYVINTCSVTENANKECKRIIRKAKKNSPKSFIIVTGCFAQLKPKEISLIEEVDMVLGANDKFNIPNLVNNLTNNQKAEIHGCEIESLNYTSSYSLNDRSRSFMKIQDGCDYPCTYCTIPLARGKSRSDSIKNILENVKNIANKGIKEIVLTGVNIGDFKDKYDGRNFTELIKELDKIDGVERYRISSIEPNLITDEIIDLISKSHKFMPHFHIPLQSGSDKILSKMKRRYQTKLYKEKVKKISSKIQNVSIGADVIVGFPGETEEEFKKTLNFIKSLPISYLHVFSYSERENTKALEYNNIIKKETRANRSKQLRILSEKLKISFYNSQIKNTHIALFEKENKNGMLHGYTDNYIKVKVNYNDTLCQTKRKIKLCEIDIDGIMNAQIIN